MSNGIVEDHDQEALIYHSYQCAYFVQSPSTVSHANSTDIRSNIQHDTESTAFHSPIRSETQQSNPTRDEEPALCRYSSSRGSFSLHHKKISYDSSHGTVNPLVIVDAHDNDKFFSVSADDDYYYSGNGNTKRGWNNYFSYRYSDSCAWISLQITWRVMLSFGIALLVFYVATKPPSPNISLEIARFQEFKLGEGVDITGVTTKILTCNCSMNLIIENKSRFFGLHIRPPIMDMKFSILPFAFSNGPELYAESGLTIFTLQLGAKNKPMYGAGRSMQDMLDSGRGLPIVIRVTLSSSFQMVPILIKPRETCLSLCRPPSPCVLLLVGAVRLLRPSMAAAPSPLSLLQPRRRSWLPLLMVLLFASLNAELAIVAEKLLQIIIVRSDTKVTHEIFEFYTGRLKGSTLGAREGEETMKSLNVIIEMKMVAKEAIGRARRGEGPTLVECETYRFKGHSLVDPDELRDPGEHLCRQYFVPLCS
ncbi:thiamine diphosphate-binding fold [Sesbania bispinosa]|nr:thiamine diphosphate-binding fold [Sesbania bispinosa]